MIPPDLEFVGVISSILDGDMYYVRFKLSDGRECAAYWTHDDLRRFMTPRTVDAQSRPAPTEATLQ